MLSPQTTLQQMDPREGTPSGALAPLHAARKVLFQGLELLFQLNARSYSQPAGTLFVTTIGEQYRRMLERFQALIRGLRAGEIWYGKSEGNSRLQQDVTYASVATCDVLRALKGYTHETLRKECKVTRDAVHDAFAADSKIGSELAHCIGQALHHYAMIRVLCMELRIATPAEFGELPSSSSAFEFGDAN